MVAAAGNVYSLLITDDDDALRDTLRTVFEPEGYDTYLASCGTEAIRVVRQHRIHVVILDMHMPDLDGLETICRIRDITQTPIPYVLMSGDESKELHLKALAAEAYSLIPKPFNVGIMRQVVEEIIMKYYA